MGLPCVVSWLSTLLVALAQEERDLEADYLRRHERVVERDAFPVFDHPELLTAEEAEESKVVRERDLVIGVARGEEAKAYPVAVMGIHELGNDTIGGLPIAPSW